MSQVYYLEKTKGKVKIINDILENYCDITPKLKFTRIEQICDKMLSDRKHLNVDVVFKLLANIRYSLFGKLPKGPRRNDTYSNSQRYPNYQINRYN